MRRSFARSLLLETFSFDSFHNLSLSISTLMGFPSLISCPYLNRIRMIYVFWNAMRYCAHLASAPFISICHWQWIGEEKKFSKTNRKQCTLRKKLRNKRSDCSSVDCRVRFVSRCLPYLSDIERFARVGELTTITFADSLVYLAPLDQVDIYLVIVID